MDKLAEIARTFLCALSMNATNTDPLHELEPRVFDTHEKMNCFEVPWLAVEAKTGLQRLCECNCSCWKKCIIKIISLSTSFS